MQINPIENSSARKSRDVLIVARFKICFALIDSLTGVLWMNQTFTVTGMTCGHCEKAVTRAIRQLDPQAEVQIDRAANKVQVQSTQPRDVLSNAIAEEGYAVAA
jgi:copper chaperone